jgi:hypothetical protein
MFKLVMSPGIDSKESIPSAYVAGRYDNPIPTRFLAPTECLKITARGNRNTCQPPMALVIK